MSIVDQGHHITLFSVPWQNDMKNVVSIQQCVELIHSLGLKIRSLCLDREFFNAAILRYLQQSGIPHIIPVKKHGKVLNAMLKGWASSTFSYTMKEGSQVSNKNAHGDIGQGHTDKSGLADDPPNLLRLDYRWCQKTA
jgi:putative transposase